MEESKKLKVFVSLPMNGRDEQEVKDSIQYLFNDYKKFSGLENLELIDNFIEESPPKEVRAHFWYRTKSLQLLLESDVVIMDYNWETSPGCMLELQTALGCGKAVVFN